MNYITYHRLIDILKPVSTRSDEAGVDGLENRVGSSEEVG